MLDHRPNEGIPAVDIPTERSLEAIARVIAQDAVLRGETDQVIHDLFAPHSLSEDPAQVTPNRIPTLESTIATLTEQLEAKSRELDQLRSELTRLKAEASFDAVTIRQLQHEVARLQLLHTAVPSVAGEVELAYIVAKSSTATNLNNPALVEVQTHLQQGWHLLHVNTGTVVESPGKSKVDVPAHYAHFVLQRVKPPTVDTPPSKPMQPAAEAAESVTAVTPELKPDPTPIDPVEPTEIVLVQPPSSLPPVPPPPDLERDMAAFREGKASMAEILASWDAQTAARSKAVALRAYAARRPSPFNPFPVNSPRS